MSDIKATDLFVVQRATGADAGTYKVSAEDIPSTAVVSATQPSDPLDGEQWFDTANSVLKVWDGDSWELCTAAVDPGVTKIIAGTNVTISPTGGTGDVTVNASGGGGGISDAPNDGKQYGRQSQSWTEITGGSGGPTINYNGASAWCKFNGSNGSIDSNFNVASVTRTNNGLYTVAFTNAMPSANYSIVASSSGTSGSNLGNVDVPTQSATGFTLRVANQNNTTGDPDHVYFTCHAVNSQAPRGTTGADAWATVDKQTSNGACTVPASFNIASVTRSGTGLYDVVFTNAMPTANYSIVGASVNTGSGTADRIVTYRNRATTGCTIDIRDGNGTAQDAAFSCVINATNATLPLTITQDQIESAINNPGAAAWGNVSSSGSLLNGMNTASVTRTATGKYDVVFAKRMPDSNYAVNATVKGAATFGFIANVTSISTTGFSVCITSTSDVTQDLEFYYAVFATNALPPAGGTGTDAWAACQSDGTVDASFNVASVTRTSTGVYSVVFTTAMPTANYAVTCSGASSASAFVITSGRTVTGFTLNVNNSNGASTNMPFGFAVNATNATLPLTVTQDQIEAAIKNPGASAWGDIASDGTLNGGLNVSTSRTSTGNYSVVFNTAMPDANYAIAFGSEGYVQELPNSKTASGFSYTCYSRSGSASNFSSSFVVHSTNALPPTGGTGTDAWAAVAANGTLNASFNIASVTKTSTGVYSVVFTNAMPTANYAVTLSGEGNTCNVNYPLSTTGFSYRSQDGGTLTDLPTSFSVNATNATIPQTFTEEEIQSAINNPGISAWAQVEQTTSNGPCVVGGANNISSVTRTGKGRYDIVFATAMPNANYSAIAAPIFTSTISSGDSRFALVNSKTANGFSIQTKKGNDNADYRFDIMVAATNALPPRSGTGADAWAASQSDGTIDASFNVASVTKTSTGVYSVVFTTAMPTANYSVVASVCGADNSSSVYARNLTTTGFRIDVYNVSGSAYSDAPVAFQVHATNATLPTTFTEAQIQGVIDAKPQGIAKAWINFDGTGTVAIRDSFNISSVTDNGTGLYRLNFTTAMANSSYAVIPGGSRELPESSRCFPANIDQITTGSFDLSTHNDGSTSVDWELVTCVVHGD